MDASSMKPSVDNAKSWIFVGASFAAGWKLLGIIAAGIGWLMSQVGAK